MCQTRWDSCLLVSVFLPLNTWSVWDVRKTNKLQAWLSSRHYLQHGTTQAPNTGSLTGWPLSEAEFSLQNNIEIEKLSFVDPQTVACKHFRPYRCAPINVWTPGGLQVASVLPDS